MKKTICVITASLMMVFLAACQRGGPDVVLAQTKAVTASANIQENTSAETGAAADITAPDNRTGHVQEENKKQQIRILAGEKTVVFELNGSAAAESLYQQLPLTVEVENYSDNEKIFYPPEKLDLTDTPQAASGAGTLAYYAPWGDVVMFFGEYSPNSQLYELGRVVSGSEDISSLSGTLQIQ